MARKINNTSNIHAEGKTPENRLTTLRMDSWILRLIRQSTLFHAPGTGKNLLTERLAPSAKDEGLWVTPLPQNAHFPAPLS